MTNLILWLLSDILRLFIFVCIRSSAVSSKGIINLKIDSGEH